jgi:hypothetical protein
LSSFSFTYNFWVTLPCAVQFLICAPTNGGNLKVTVFISMCLIV